MGKRGRGRKKGTTVRWCLEEEIAKVLEKGVALGGIRTRLPINGGGRNNSQDDSNTIIVDVDVEGNDLTWCLEEEITKVIKTGVALGVDFVFEGNVCFDDNIILEWPQRFSRKGSVGKLRMELWSLSITSFGFLCRILSELSLLICYRLQLWLVTSKLAQVLGNEPLIREAFLEADAEAIPILKSSTLIYGVLV
ncbi:hypothetical protein LWI28_014916 [Acer negundo]|uniref:Uncharacterized protein n=1 Tax=Acer negundo TaxID=4023 RepID=A0AAD5JTS4_ACENE|nr:hypothetical protein LWI28_014916 [Acer negundo]